MALLGWGEWVHAHSRTTTPATRLPIAAPEARCAVIVLGFANRRSRPNVVNRWRARIGVRTARRLERAGVSVTSICSGGAVRGDVPEAVLLHREVVGPLGWHGATGIESESCSTWENVRNTLPLIESGSWISYASNGLHAAKAESYLTRQRPELAGRILPAADYRFGEMIWAKPLFAAVGLRKRRAAFPVEQASPAP